MLDRVGYLPGLPPKDKGWEGDGRRGLDPLVSRQGLGAIGRLLVVVDDDDDEDDEDEEEEEEEEEDEDEDEEEEEEEDDEE